MIHGTESSPSDFRTKNNNALIKHIHGAVNSGYIHEPFSAQNIERWMSEFNIRQDDGSKYSEGYAATLLSCSLIKKKMTKNRNSKWLRRRISDEGIYLYWFEV